MHIEVQKNYNLHDLVMKFTETLMTLKLCFTMSHLKVELS